MTDLIHRAGGNEALDPSWMNVVTQKLSSGRRVGSFATWQRGSDLSYLVDADPRFVTIVGEDRTPTTIHTTVLTLCISSAMYMKYLFIYRVVNSC